MLLYDVASLVHDPSTAPFQSLSLDGTITDIVWNTGATEKWSDTLDCIDHEYMLTCTGLGCRFDSFVVLSAAGTLTYYRGDGNTVDYPQVAIKQGVGKTITAGTLASTCNFQHYCAVVHT